MPANKVQIIVNVTIDNNKMDVNVVGPLNQKAFVIKALSIAINSVVDYMPPQHAPIIPAHQMPKNGSKN